MIFNELTEISKIVWNAHAQITNRYEILEEDIRQKQTSQLTTSDKDSIIESLIGLTASFETLKNDIDRFIDIEKDIDRLIIPDDRKGYYRRKAESEEDF